MRFRYFCSLFFVFVFVVEALILFFCLPQNGKLQTQQHHLNIQLKQEWHRQWDKNDNDLEAPGERRKILKSCCFFHENKGFLSTLVYSRGISAVTSIMASQEQSDMLEVVLLSGHPVLKWKLK